MLKVFISAYVRFGNALAWHALETCRGLHAAGHTPYLFCQRGSPLAEWSMVEPYPVNRELNLNRADPGEIWKGISLLRREIQSFAPDILNPHCPPGHTYLALARYLEKFPSPLIRTVAEPRSPKRNPFNRRLHEKLTNGVIFTTESSRQRYSNVFSLSHARAATISPGFRADDFANTVVSRSYRQQLGVKEDQVLAGIIARMSPEKGQEVLLEALSLLPENNRSNFHVVMAGSDTRERTTADLKVLAQRLGVERQVSFVGELDDVRPLMAELDLGIITSTSSEAICRVALEYMSFGIPIIASNVNILPEVVRNGVNGWVFQNRDARALALALEAALHDTADRKQKGRNGHELVRNQLSLAHEIQQLVDFYESTR